MIVLFGSYILLFQGHSRIESEEGQSDSLSEEIDWINTLAIGSGFYKAIGNAVWMEIVLTDGIRIHISDGLWNGSYQIEDIHILIIIIEYCCSDCSY